MGRDLRLPDLGEGVASGELRRWLVDVGETVSEDRPVAEIGTEEGIVEISAPVDGTVETLHADPGDTVQVGAPFVTVAAEANDAQRPAATDDGPTEKRVFAPPHVRRLARECGVDPGEIDGSGPGGRLTEEDVRAAATAGDDTAATAGKSDDAEDDPGAQSITATPADGATDRDRTLATPATRELATELGVDIDAVPASEQRGGDAFVTAEGVRTYAETSSVDADSSSGADETDETTGTDRDSGFEMHPTVSERGPHSTATVPSPAHSAISVPVTTHYARVDATGLIATRERLQPLADDRDVRLPYLPIVLKAIVGALADHPLLNATIDEDAGEVLPSQEFDLGVAVGTERGLVTPVVEAVDEKPVLEVAGEVAERLERAREEGVGGDETRGGRFTVTDFGAVGAEYATLAPADSGAAALALGSLAQRPTVEGGSITDPGEVVAGPVVPLSLSVDSRAVDGAEASRFLDTLGEYLRDPTPALLD